MPGDQLDIFGDPELAPKGWCPPLEPYDFLSEGDNVADMPLLHTGIEAPQDPTLGGWGGRSRQVTASPDLWTLVDTEKDASGAEVPDYTTLRWAGAAQNDFAARMRWTLTPRYRSGNHEPRVGLLGHDTVRVAPAGPFGSTASPSTPIGTGSATSGGSTARKVRRRARSR